MRRRPSLSLQRGAAAVEFGFAISLFVTAAFGLLEFVRLMATYNTAHAVARTVARSASITSFVPAALDAAKRAAIVADANGDSTIFDRSTPASRVSVDTIQVKYLGFDLNELDALPASPDANVTTCKHTSGSGNCVRFVQVRLCQAGSNCTSLDYTPLVPVFPAIALPPFTVILPVQSLGCSGTCP